MIVEKNKASSPSLSEEVIPVKVQMPHNGLIDVFKSIKQILREVRWEYGNPASSLIFNTVQRNDGQFERIIVDGANKEDSISFPAVFIHFVNIHWLKSTGRIREGRAELRIKFVMNRLNVHDDDDTESEIDYVAQRIKQDFEEKRYDYECLTERLYLDYYDPMETFNDSLQACWMNWEVWFRETSVWVTRYKTRKHIVMPPFTNHADQDESIPGVNPDLHGNLVHPTSYDEATFIKYEGVKTDDDDGVEDDEE